MKKLLHYLSAALAFLLLGNRLYAQQASNLSVSVASSTSITINSWTNNSGNHSAVFVFAGTTGAPAPVNTTNYAANAVFGSGAQIGVSGWYCVYNSGPLGTTGAGPVTVTGLTSGTTYRVMVVDYTSNSSPTWTTGTVATNPVNITPSGSSVKRVTAIATGTQTGTATYGTAAPTITYVNTLTETGTTAAVSNSISVAWSGGTPTGVTTAFTAGTQAMTSGSAYTPNGTNGSTITLTVSTTAATPAGTYTFTVTNIDNNGGGTTTSIGTLVVAKAALTITANSQSKTFGTTFTFAGTEFAIAGLKNSDNVTAATITSAGSPATANVGAYNIVPALPLTGNASFLTSNYTISFVNGTMTVNKAALTITANTNNKTYGTTLTGGAGSTAFTATGLQNGDTIGSLTIAFGTGSAATAAVGTYASQITVSAATGGTFAAGNYIITYVKGTINVIRATLTITANSVTKAFGVALTGGSGSTAFTATGLATGETIGSVTIAYGTGALATDAVGSYPGQVFISAATGGTFTAGNYLMSYVAGNITITPPPPAITYTPSTTALHAGVALPALTPVNTGGAVSSFGFGTGTALTGATLNTPYGIGINPVNGNIYVTNSGSGTISYYNATGVYQGTLTATFTQPVGIVFDSSGNGYVTDRNNGTVYKVSTLGVRTTLITGFTSLRGIAIDASNNLYVVSGFGNAVYKYSTSGTLLLTLNNTNTAYPTGAAVDGSGNIYVVDRTNGNVTKYNTSGGYVSTFATGFGTGGGNGPYAIAVDASGNVYVSDTVNNQVKVYDSSGTLIATLTGLNTPYGLTLDSSGNLYVVNQGTPSVVKYPRVGGYTISSTLPAGLSFDPTTGTISGTPTVTFASTTYTVTAYNAYGSGSTTVTLSCTIVTPAFHYSPSTNVYNVYNAIPALSPIVTAGVIGTAGFGTGTVISSTLNVPQGVTIGPGPAYNIYVANAGARTINVYSSAGTNIGTFGTVAGAFTGFSNPVGIVFDSSGNGYVLDVPAGGGGPGYVYKFNSSGTYQATLNPRGGTGFRSGFGIAIDASNNIYVAENGNGNVYKFNPGGTAPTYGMTTIALPGFGAPAQIVTDASGNFYVVSNGNGAVYKYNSSGTLVSTLISGLNNPFGLAIDNSGNLYVGDSGTGLVSEYNSAGTLITSISGLTDPEGIAADASGNLYVTDASNGTLIKYPLISGYTISSALPAGLSFNNSTGVFSGTPTTIFGPTTYTVTAYSYGVSTTTTVTLSCILPAPAISYTPATDVYCLGTTITPLVPVNTGGAVSAMTYSTGTQITGAVLNNPYGIGTDASGNIYVTNSGTGTIVRYTSAGVYSAVYATGLSTPVGIVFDSSGNAYVLNRGANAVIKITTAGVQSNLITGIASLRGIAMSASGNLYITSGGGNAIYEYTTAGALVTTFPTAYTSYPNGIAVDPSGNVYVLDRTNNNVVEFTSSGTYLSTFATGFNTAYGLSIDAAGNVYVGDSGNDTIDVYNAAGVLLASITSNLNSPFGLTTDAYGNIYETNNGNTRVYKYTVTGNYSISPALPTGLAFNTVTGAITGTPTAISASTVYTINCSNATGTASTTVNITTGSCSLADWIGVTSSDWNTASNWSTGVVPTSITTANIGVNQTFSNFPNIGPSGAATNTIAAVVIGSSSTKLTTGTSASAQAGGFVITTGHTLNVLGAITYQSDANAGTLVASISGAGTVNAASVNVIANTTLAGSYTEQLNSSVSNFNIGGNVTLTSAKPASNAFNSTFSVTGGATAVTGTIQTVNAAGSTSSLTVAPASTATLKLANSAALSGLSATGTNVITFNNTGATVEYSGAGQTVYTDVAITGLTTGPSYYSIKFSGTGIKLPNGTTTNNINISGDFTNALTLNDAADYINLGSPNVIFNGTTQNIYAGNGTGTTFYNVKFSGTGTTTIQSGNAYVASSGVLTMSGSSAVLAAGGLLTLNSDATGSATVAQIPAGCSITGNVNVQRYITGGSVAYRGYRLVSSPVYANTVGSNHVYSVNYLLNSIYLKGTNGVAGGFDASGNPNLYLFRENLAPSNTSFTSGNFRGMSDLSASPSYSIDNDGSGFNIPVGNGYMLFFRGDRSVASLTTESSTTYVPTGTTLTATGLLNQGQVTVSDWYTPGSTNLGFTTTAGNAPVQGFNLVGNPYASSIDWDQFNTASSTTGIYGGPGGAGVATNPFLYILDPVSKNYNIYESGFGGVGTIASVGSNIIPSGQGFFVVAPTATAQLVFNESAKVNSQVSTTNGNLFLGPPPVANVIQYMHLKLFQDSTNADGMLISFNGSARPQYNINEDAIYKPGNGTVSLASISADNIALAINTMPLPGPKPMAIPLTVNANTDGNFTIKLEAVKSVPALYDFWLKDAFAKDSLDIRHNPSYAFTLAHSDTNTFGAHRFSLIIRQNPALMVHLLNFGATKVANGDQVIWTTENEQNYTSFAVERSTDGGSTFNELGGVPASGIGSYSLLDKTPVLGANAYRLKMTDLNGTVTYSNVVTIMYANTGNQIATNGFILYPNPTAGPMNVKMNQINAGQAYTIQIINNLGAVIKTVTSNQPNWQTDVSSLVPGTYFVEVKNNSTNALVGKSGFVKL